MGELLTRRRFTVEEYHRMGEAGILPEDNRLELIAGDIVVREPIGAHHAGTVDRLTRLWTSRLGDRAIVRIQNPVQFPREDSELQPDVMLLRPREDFYTTRHPEAADALLLIEVAEALALHNLALVKRDLCKLDEAEESLRRAYELRDKNANTPPGNLTGTIFEFAQLNYGRAVSLRPLEDGLVECRCGRRASARCSLPSAGRPPRPNSLRQQGERKRW